MCNYVDTGLFPLSIHPTKTHGGGMMVLHSPPEETEAQRGKVTVPELKADLGPHPGLHSNADFFSFPEAVLPKRSYL